MKAPALFREYIWLVRTICQAKDISLSEINARWIETDMSEGVPFSRTTFNRHKDAIQDIFGIIIDCDRRNGYKYYIANEEVLQTDSVQNWMLSTISVSNLLSESLSLQHRILLENVPSGGELLQQIIGAMKDGKRILITYRRYGAVSATSFSLSPYCVKLFRQRWYLLGKFRNDNFVVFSLDRIEALEVLTEKFSVDDNFDAALFFNDCFGIVAGDGTKAERIVLRAYGTEQNYMRDLPLHHSQREIFSSEEYGDYEYYLRPTSDFKAHLLSRGALLEVLEPQSLADEIVEWHKYAIMRYEKKL